MSKFKSIFIREDETKSTDGKGAATNTVQQPVIQPEIQPTYSAGVQGMVNEKILQSLKEVIEKNNITGADYYELSIAVGQLTNIIPDEKTRMLAAFSTLKTSAPDISKEKLLSSIDTYVQLLNKEKESFSADLKQRFNDSVGKKTKAVADAQQKLIDLQKEQTTLNQFIIEESQKAQQEELKLKQVESNFNATMAHLLGIMEADKLKITQFIQ
jgi:predicted  nucleic acid-binding Zn-ribbon protein